MHKEGWHPEPFSRPRCHPERGRRPGEEPYDAHAGGVDAGGGSRVFIAGVPACCSGSHQRKGPSQGLRRARDDIA